MDRLPFNPEKMAAKKEPAAPKPTGAAPLSVTDLAALIDGVLKDKIPSGLRVVGELSGFSDRTHWYFNLKDENAVVSCVMFASAAKLVRFRPGNGMRVIAKGRVEFFAKQGKTQLYITSLEQVGVGELELRLRALCEELRTLGWFAPERKRPLPTFPRRIGIITSKTGAALQDVLDTMRRRCPAIEVALIDVLVQGPGAAPGVAAAIRWASQNHATLGLDALIVTRGGGSMEDLWAFNERIVAEAILNCEIPVVAAIGHETDTTIAELVADERGATPTQAAMRLTPDRAALLEQLSQLGLRSRGVILRNIRHDAQRLDAASRHPAISDPGYVLDRARDTLGMSTHKLASTTRHALSSHRVHLERLGGRLSRHEPRGLYAARRAALDHAAIRLVRVVRTRLEDASTADLNSRLFAAWSIATERRATSLAALERELAVVGPMSVLARGYSVTTGPDGSIIRSRADASPGAPITTRVADGTFRSIIEGGGGESAPAQRPDLPPRRRTPPRSGRIAPRDQLDLF